MKELRVRWMLKLTTALTLSACYAVLLVAFLSVKNISHFLTLWGEEVQLTAYLKPEISEADVSQIKAELQKKTEVGAVDYISQQQALIDFKRQMSHQLAGLGNEDELLSLIPASFQIGLSSAIPISEQSDVMLKLADEIRSLSFIEEVSYGQDWVKQFSQLTGLAQKTSWILSFVIFAAILLVIGNAIRASLEGRRQEIEVMELLGATSWYLRKPYLKEGAFLAAGSYLAGCLVVYIGFYLTRDFLIKQDSFARMAHEIQYFSFGFILLGLILSTGFGLLASFLCLRKMNTGWSAASAESRR